MWSFIVSICMHLLDALGGEATVAGDYRMNRLQLQYFADVLVRTNAFLDEVRSSTAYSNITTSIKHYFQLLYFVKLKRA